jgi:YaiO family outer membrane protein
MFTARVYLTPGPAGTSQSLQLQTRRYFADGIDYWGVRYGHGSSPAETQGIYGLQLLNASSLTFEVRRTLHRRLIVQGRFGISRGRQPHSIPPTRPLPGGWRCY